MKKRGLLNLARERQREIEGFYLFRILPFLFSSRIRKTRHFREWFALPMNYVRMIELPLTIEFLRLDKNHSILDISSPKLLAL